MHAPRLEVWSAEVTYQREYHRGGAPGQARPHTSLSRLVGNPVLALQRAIGNRGTTQFLARDKKKNKGTFEHSVQIGKLGPIEVKESNAGEFTTKSSPEVLTVTTTKGKHSDELKRMAESKSRVEKLSVSTITGQNSWVIVTFSNARIRGYEADDGTEHWKAVDFDGVHIDRTSIGTPRP